MHSVGVSGHQNIPDQALGFIQREVELVLRRFGRQFVGISSLAVGADQLFAAAVLRAGGRLHAVIPCQGYEATFTDAEALESFSDLLARADPVETLAYEQPSEDAFLAAGHWVVALADVLVAVWDGQEAKGKGGTADIVRYARAHQKEVLVVWPPGVTR